MNVYCEEAPGSVLFTDPAEDFGHCSLSENERTHFAELKDRYRQCRDRNRELVAQLSTLNSRTNKLNATEIHLRAKRRMFKSIVGSILSLLRYATSRMR